MFSTHPLDWLAVGLYVAFLAAVWLRARGARVAAADYLVAGRAVTLPGFVASLVSTWYGGILGVGEYSFRHGLSNWLVFGVPYYLGALLFALLFARRARAAALYTLPDLLDRSAGRGAALMGAVAVFVTAAPAAYVLMLGTLVAAMTGAPLAPCVIAAALLSVFYVDRGGLRAVVFTDRVQFALMFAGFALLLAVLVAGHGTLPFLEARLPATHWTWHGGNPPATIFVWYVIALGTLVDPAFWQRAYAAKDATVARRGVLISIGCWIAFDAMTTACGLYARALLPALEPPVFAFPELAKLALPAGALGLFYVGMIATVMSTIDSYAFVAATTVGRDLVWRLRPGAAEERIPAWSRLGLWLAGGFAAALALARTSVIELWRELGSIAAPTLLLPVAAALTGRGRLGPRWTLAAMLAPFLVTVTWVLSKSLLLGGARYPFALEPIYAGLAASLAVHGAGWLFGKERLA